MACVKFEAVLKNNGIGGWCIDLTDTLEPVTVRCENLEYTFRNCISLPKIPNFNTDNIS